MNWDISFRETHDRDSGACVTTGNTVFPSPKARKKKLMTTLGDTFVAIFTRFRLTYLLMQLGSIKHTNGSLPEHLYRGGLRRTQYFACPRIAFMKIQLSVNYRREITNIVARISRRLFYVRTEIYRPDPTRPFVRSFLTQRQRVVSRVIHYPVFSPGNFRSGPAREAFTVHYQESDSDFKKYKSYFLLL